MMIQPIVTANQSVNNSAKASYTAKTDKAEKAEAVSFTGAQNATNTVSKADAVDENEKMDVNCEGCRIHSLNGNKVNYFA